ncbi:unnamed protein product [Caenorhabditis angaria]|uniref:Uncharacterized protein n=1 Tax=Caenorhabditis angaria TaxID=860376 RepID=A0A9P1I4Y7_9PELO|nr:unnamed protein product [Caenorhabditis angaria]
MSQMCLLVFLQCLVAICGAYPYLVVSSTSEPPTRHLVKRAFDRFDNEGIFSFGAKRYDRMEDYQQYGNNDMNRYLFKRSFDNDLDFGLRRKRSFDRIAGGEFGFDYRKKRSFDRIGGSEFGLVKRSLSNDDERETLIDNLAESIVALRNARAIENQPIVIAYDRKK